VCRRNYEVALGIYIRVLVSLYVTSVCGWLIKGLDCIYCNGQYDSTIERELGLNTRGNNTVSGPWTE